ncbi:MAG: hypothetical protein AB2L21_03505 [Anaerolineaceae bacterium]
MKKPMNLTAIVSVLCVLSACAATTPVLQQTGLTQPGEQVETEQPLILQTRTPPLPTAAKTETPGIAQPVPSLAPTPLPPARGVPQRKTYAFDAEEIQKYCIEFPQKRIYYPFYVNDKFYFQVNAQGALYSYSPVDQTLNVFAEPDFDPGFIFGMFSYEYPWFIYAEVDNPGGTGAWKLHAVNLKDDTNTVIADSSTYHSIPLHTYTALKDGKVYLSTTTFASLESYRSQIHSIDLATGEVRLVLEDSDKETFYSMVEVSNDLMVIENDPPTRAGLLKLHLTLYNLNKRTWQTLPQKIPASCPSIEYPYVTWKNNYRFDYADSITIYNLEDDSSHWIKLIGESPQDPYLSGPYVLWEVSLGQGGSKTSVILYAIEQNTYYAVQNSMNKTVVTDSNIMDDSLVWSFYSSASAFDYSSWVCRMPLDEILSKATEGIDFEEFVPKISEFE